MRGRALGAPRELEALGYKAPVHPCKLHLASIQSNKNAMKQKRGHSGGIPLSFQAPSRLAVSSAQEQQDWGRGRRGGGGGDVALASGHPAHLGRSPALASVSTAPSREAGLRGHLTQTQPPAKRASAVLTQGTRDCRVRLRAEGRGCVWRLRHPGNPGRARVQGRHVNPHVSEMPFVREPGPPQPNSTPSQGCTAVMGVRAGAPGSAAEGLASL